MNQLETFVDQLHQQYHTNPLALRELVIFFRNHAMRQAFKKLFLKTFQSEVCVLPRTFIWPQLTWQDVHVLTGSVSAHEHIVAPHYRRLLLMRQLGTSHLTDQPMTYREKFAQKLAGLIDDLNYSGMDIADCKALLPFHFQDQWLPLLDLIENMIQSWRSWLYAQGHEDRSRIAALAWQHLYQQWLMHPPSFPLYIVGSIPAYKALAPLRTWLLHSKKAIHITGHNEAIIANPLHQALSQETFVAMDQEQRQELGKKFHFIEARNREHEAQLLAQVIQHHLSVKNTHIVIISDDAWLQNTLMAILASMRIDMSGTVSQSILDTKLGLQTTLLAESFKNWSIPEKRFATIKALIDSPNELQAAEHSWRSSLQPDVKTLVNALSDDEVTVPQKASWREYISIHKKLCRQYLAQSFDEGGSTSFALKDLWSELQKATADWDEISAEEYARVWRTLLSEELFVSHKIEENRVSFWKLEDIAFCNGQVVIIPNMNDDCFPPSRQDNPWLPNHLAEQMMLGDMSYDDNLRSNFVNLLSAEFIYCSRATNAQTTPSLPSSWWIRLQALLKKQPFTGENHNSQSVGPAHQPRIRVPLALRPKLYSATEIESLMRDPYIIFAKKILHLRPLRDYDKQLTAADKGNFIHRALELFIANRIDPFGNDAFDNLLMFAASSAKDCGINEAFQKLWWPRFKRIGSWFIEQQKMRHQHTASSHVEIWGNCAFVLSDNTSITLRAKVDRIDVSSSKAATIIDYKTGQTPSKTDVRKGFSPQLALEGLILRKQGFKGLENVSLEALEYWSLSGDQEAGEIARIDDQLDELLNKTEQGLRALLEYYQRHETDFIANDNPDTRPQYNDYDDFSRYRLWIHQS